jgi:hypothetical protein
MWFDPHRKLAELAAHPVKPANPAPRVANVASVATPLHPKPQSAPLARADVLEPDAGAYLDFLRLHGPHTYGATHRCRLPRGACHILFCLADPHHARPACRASTSCRACRLSVRRPPVALQPHGAQSEQRGQKQPSGRRKGDRGHDFANLIGKPGMDRRAGMERVEEGPGLGI